MIVTANYLFVASLRGENEEFGTYCSSDFFPTTYNNATQ